MGIVEDLDLAVVQPERAEDRVEGSFAHRRGRIAK